MIAQLTNERFTTFVIGMRVNAMKQFLSIDNDENHYHDAMKQFLSINNDENYYHDAMKQFLSINNDANYYQLKYWIIHAYIQ